MSRWKPDAHGRLALAAMELYVEKGFEQTTVAEIAERAGLTERTFFRQFADKREVIFQGQDEFQAVFVDAVTEAPADATPLDAISAALYAVAEVFDGEGRRPWSIERQKVIAANPALQEREAIKLSRLAVAIAEALRDRGVAEPTASVTGQTCVGIFHVSFAQWIDPASTRSFVAIIDDAIAALRALTQ